jgi:hypothetical protein
LGSPFWYSFNHGHTFFYKICPEKNAHNPKKVFLKAIAYENGIVEDRMTGLEWKAGPDKDNTWDEARSWVQRLNVDGGGWRMPTMDELAGL